MRVIGGTLKGRTLQGPADDRVRPTSDRLRETLFNVLATEVPGARVLDGYAGTAAVGIEAISRGAADVEAWEVSPPALRVARANIDACGVGDRCRLLRGDFLRSHGGADRTIVFLDPPYDAPDLVAPVQVAAARLEPGGVIVLEHRRSRESPEAVEGLTRVRVLKAGDSALSFYRYA